MAIFVTGLTGGAKAEEFKYKIVATDMTFSENKFTGGTYMTMILGDIVSANQMFVNSSYGTFNLDLGDTCKYFENGLGKYGVGASMTTVYLKVGKEVTTLKNLMVQNSAKSITIEWSENPKVTTMSGAFEYTSVELKKLDIPASVTDISYIGSYGRGIFGIMNIYGNPTSYNGAFNEMGAYSTDKQTVINYSSICTNINNIMATAKNSNAVKGSLIVS